VPEAIEIQLKKGVLALCVLALLSRADSYAYEIASKLAKDIDMGEGTIYPLMRRMQSDGLVETYLVESQSGPAAQVLSPDPGGSDQLHVNRRPNGPPSPRPSRTSWEPPHDP
jgi:PadR family transcriptional regulator PadR